jgi:hypothetical protein
MLPIELKWLSKLSYSAFVDEMVSNSSLRRAKLELVQGGNREHNEKEFKQLLMCTISH